MTYVKIIMFQCYFFVGAYLLSMYLRCISDFQYLFVIYLKCVKSLVSDTIQFKHHGSYSLAGYSQLER